MKFMSVCSGIEAASVAWNPLGWQAVAFSEIASFPRALGNSWAINCARWIGERIQAVDAACAAREAARPQQGETP